ncbi:nucleotide exchange factor GrpE [Endozoicomonas sp. Mp262]|uniref:nucleotide exchange factor GrpE n=1 Tax=Endozoicomonas sp. Mp262 TaxID=2919499 RepID=UPI0021D7FB69
MTVENGKAEEQLQSAEEVVIEKESPELTEELMQKEGESLENATLDQNDSGWQQRIEELTAELDKAKDLALRAQAEMQNVKRRAELDVEKAHKYALDKFVESLLPVVDSLEKGIESAAQAEGGHDAMKEGMELTLKLFLDTLERFKVQQMNPEGEPFDPNFHQAMSMVPNPSVEPNTIMAVFQKGYTLNERVVRPAMVVVAKGA